MRTASLCSRLRGRTVRRRGGAGECEPDVPQYPVDDRAVGDERYDPHRGTAPGTEQRILTSRFTGYGSWRGEIVAPRRPRSPPHWSWEHHRRRRRRERIYIRELYFVHAYISALPISHQHANRPLKKRIPKPTNHHPQLPCK